MITVSRGISPVRLITMNSHTPPAEPRGGGERNVPYRYPVRSYQVLSRALFKNENRIVLFYLILLHNKRDMALTDQQKQEVAEVMRQYAGGYREKDALAILALCSPDISGFGSGADEIARSKAELEVSIPRDLSQADFMDMTFPRMKIYGTMPVAWVTTECNVRFVIGGVAGVMAGRMTAGLLNTGSRWLLEQVHFSMPFSGQNVGQSFPGAKE